MSPRTLLARVRARRAPQRVRLHLANAQPSLEGQFAGVHAGRYVLVDPVLVAGERDRTQLAGSVEVPASNVVFVQRLPW